MFTRHLRTTPRRLTIWGGLANLYAQAAMFADCVGIGALACILSAPGFFYLPKRIDGNSPACGRVAGRHIFGQ